MGTLFSNNPRGKNPRRNDKRSAFRNKGEENGDGKAPDAFRQERD